MCPERYHAVWLCSTVTDNAVRKKLLTAFVTPSGVYAAEKEELQEQCGLAEETAGRLVSTRNAAYCDKLLAKMDRDGIRFLWHEDEKFPDRLRRIPDAPVGLFVQGSLPPSDLPLSVAVIGTRRASPYGELVARQFGQAFGDFGAAVVSGLAMGIDAAAHRGCVNGEGFPVAVLGSGIGVVYPRNNVLLYREVMDRGCICSEYGPGVPGLPHHFPHRNRIIAGLSDGVVVVEAHAKSGTLITVDRALEQGKSIYVVPGRVTDANSAGCNQLIREGAQLVTNPGEVLTDLAVQHGVTVYWETEDGQLRMATPDNGIQRLPGPSSKNKKKPLASDEKIVYAFLRLSPKHFDQLVWESGMTPSELTNILYSLERGGWIERISPGCYSVKDTES